MADKHSKEKRSYNMSQIKSKDTKPEVLVRKFLFSKGLRYRKNDKKLPGHPDIVLPKYNVIILVNGCFWHQHEDCKYSRLPESNKSFWQEKLTGNKKRDGEKIKQLQAAGWRVIIVWTCELKPKAISNRLDCLIKEIKHIQVKTQE